MSRKEVFHFLNDRKQNAASTATHIEIIIELFQNRKFIFADLSTIWVNNDGFEY